MHETEYACVLGMFVLITILLYSEFPLVSIVIAIVGNLIAYGVIRTKKASAFRQRAA
jgi:hypothetical protein